MKIYISAFSICVRSIFSIVCELIEIQFAWESRVAQWGRPLDLPTHTSLLPIRRWFAPGFVNYKKGALDSQPQVIKFNRFLHTFLGKTGWSSTSDRNFMSFREWSAAKRAKRHNNLYHEWKITRAFPTTHVSTYFFRKPTAFTIANSEASPAIDQ